MFYILLSYLLLPILRLFTLPKRNPPNRILVIQTAKIGDMICATPLFREIKLAHPSATLAVLHDPLTQPIIEFNPFIDERIPCRSSDFKSFFGKIRLAHQFRQGRFDVVVIMNPNVTFLIGALWSGIPTRLAVYPNFTGCTFRLAARFLTQSVLHYSDRLLINAYFDLLKSINVSSNNSKREVYVSPSAEEHVHKVINKSLSLIGIAVSSGNKLKAIGPDKLSKVIDSLFLIGDYSIVLIGTAGDKNDANSIIASTRHPERIIDTCGQFHLHELPALLESLQLFIGVDSGITYMADAVGIPIVLIAGPVNLAEQRPTNSVNIILRKELPCAPCAHVFKAPYSCSIGTRECIESTKADEIVKAVHQLLSSSHQPEIY